MKRVPPLILLSALWLALPAALAKLPELAPEAKAKAAEAAARTAWSNKVDAYKLCQAQDRVVAYYRNGAAAAGRAVAAAPEMPACADPGPFAYAPQEAKPIEAAGAHSPSETAASPPSSTQPAAATQQAPKGQ